MRPDDIDIRLLHEQVRIAYAYGRADARDDGPYVSGDQFANAARDAGIQDFRRIYDELANEMADEETRHD